MLNSVPMGDNATGSVPHGQTYRPRLRILGHAELFEPVHNLLHCGAPPQSTLRCATRRYLTNALT
jgi:hypothetical protein